MENVKKRKDSAAKDAATASSEARRTPVRTVRVEDCSASIWARDVSVQGSRRTFYSITLERSYKDRDGQFRYTKTFDPDSLGKVVALCEKTQQALAELESAAAVE